MELVQRQWVTVEYMRLPLGNAFGGAGSTRMWLDTLPQWLAERPGTMVYSVKSL